MKFKEIAFKVKGAVARRTAAAFLEDLERSQYLSRDALDDLTASRRADLVAFAIENSPFYRSLYGALGISAADAAYDAGWQRLPIVDRATLKASANEVPTPDAIPRNVRSALTGGSTGEPLKTMQDARVPSLAHSWRMYRWWGVEPWDNVARIGRWGFGRVGAIKNDLVWWPTKQVYLDAGLIDRHAMRRFLRRMLQTKPRLLEGYVGAMLEFADYVESSGQRIASLTAIATTAAPLTQSARLRLESVFGVPVYDEYRGSEVGWMAGECREQAGLHVFSDTRFLEVVGADGEQLPPGEVGDIVITDLTNRVFPLIRYRLGDRGSSIVGRCECGISLPRIAPPDGRTTDVLRLPSGRVLAHRIMGMFGAHPESVRLFQIHQRADHSITVRVVVGSDPDAMEHVNDAVEALRARIDHEVPVQVEIVDSLPYTRGKIKYVISDLQEDSPDSGSSQ